MTLLIGHLAQRAVWATAFMAAGEFETFAVAFFHLAGNYTTLGYGERLLGPQEAVSGTLAFGWSTARDHRDPAESLPTPRRDPGKSREFVRN